MPTPEIFDEIRQMANRLKEIVDMYSSEEESEEDAEESSMEKPDKVSSAMRMFKKEDY